MALVIRGSEWDRGLDKHAFMKAYSFIYYGNAKYNNYVSATLDSYHSKIFFFTEPTMGMKQDWLLSVTTYYHIVHAY